MRGRAKGNQERILILAHQTVTLDRQKRLLPLKSYLAPRRSKASGARDVTLLLDRLADEA